MLSLLADNRERGSSRKPPDHIPLKDGLLSFGRSYKSDIKLLYPFVSRKHFSLLRIDGHHFLEVVGSSVVFVNEVKVQQKMLNNGMTITLGGVDKKFPEGSRFPKAPSAHLIYKYSVSSSSSLLGDVYKEPLYNPNDLISLSDYVNGRMVMDVYSPDDFNETLTDLRCPDVEVSNIIPSTTVSELREHLYRFCSGLDQPVHTPSTMTSLATTTAETSGLSYSISDNKISDITADVDYSSSLQRKALLYIESDDDDMGDALREVLSSQLHSSKTCTRDRSEVDDDDDDSFLPAKLKRCSTPVNSRSRLSHRSASATVTRSDLMDENDDEDEFVLAQSSLAIASTTSSALGDTTIVDAHRAEVAGGTSNLENVDSTLISQKSSTLSVVSKTLKPFRESNCDNYCSGSSSTASTTLAPSAHAEGDLGDDLPDLCDIVDGHMMMSSSLLQNNRLTEKLSAKTSACRNPSPQKPVAKKRSGGTLLSYINVGGVREGERRGVGGDRDEEDFEEAMGRTVKRKKVMSSQGGTMSRKSMDSLVEQWQVPFDTGSVEREQPRVVDLVFADDLPGTAFQFINLQTFKVMIKGIRAELSVVDTMRSDLMVSVDIKKLERLLKSGSDMMDDVEKLCALIKKTLPPADMKIFDLPNTLEDLNFTALVSQPSALVGLRLKGYQKRNLGWMVEVEDRVGRGEEWPVSSLCEWEAANSQLRFDIRRGLVYQPPYPDHKYTTYRISTRGGILADEMGLGKTITLTALFAERPAKHIPRIPDYNHTLQSGELLPCRSNLVVAPSHLTAQWEQEISKFAPSLKILVITTILQHKKVTYADILLSDVVIVSVQYILTNKNFTKRPAGPAALAQLNQSLGRPGTNLLREHSPNLSHFRWWRLISDEAHEIITYETRKNNKTKQNEWTTSEGLKALLNIESVHRWYVTGTPFPHGFDSLRGALMFLDFKIDDPSLRNKDGSLVIDSGPAIIVHKTVKHSRYSKYSASQPAPPELAPPTVVEPEFIYVKPILEFIHSTLFIRNTKLTLGVDYDVPQFVEELMLLTFSDVERGLYDRAGSEDDRRKMCCHLQLVKHVEEMIGTGQRSLEDVKKAMIQHTNDEIESARTSIQDYESMIITATKERNAEYDCKLRAAIAARIKRYQENIEKLHDEIKTHTASVKYFEALVPNLRQTADEPCVVCFEDVRRLTVTPCGHLFCFDCIVSCVNLNGQCPTCRRNVTSDKLVEVSCPEETATLNKTAQLARLTEMFGTKMAYLIFYLNYLLKENKRSRVVIFSQWDEMLVKVGETLKENGVHNVFIKGNVFVRTKAIKSFKNQESTRVIMLSLENAASGTNLIEATHVILLDPVAGTRAEAVAVETQAIGRVHRIGQKKEITVVRMIIRNTIEQTLYVRNQPTKIQQVELDIGETSTNQHGVEIVRSIRKFDPVQLTEIIKETPVKTSKAGIDSDSNF